ncbi:MAG: 4-hydroxy-tetrahydrodipicolinate synthase [Alphaproteobacteria bacterium]|nr:4-hydroxy-tetrahydrodipicolinate synthase [Alphaproteobacteria bacterium]
MTIFKGIYTALITPFKDGKVDEKAFCEFVQWQIAEGVHGLVPCGTTGESPTLSHEEHNRVIDLCVEVANGKVPVMAGTGSNSTEEAIMTTRHAKKCGASAALVIAPYYNKPTQEGLYQHFKAINDAVDIPIIVYNVPGRTIVDISDDTIARLAELPNIVGLKDATGDLARVYTLQAKLKKPLQLLSGEDMTAVEFNLAGGQGCISVASNIAPRACAKVQEACLAGDYVHAHRLQKELVALHDVMFCETSPGPVKYAASLLGKCSSELRLPLVQPSDASKQRVREVMKTLRLI